MSSSADDERQIALEAGIFCGEGCVSIVSPKGRTLQLSVVVVNSDEALIQPFLQRFGGCYADKKVPPGCKPMKQWCVSGELAVRVCETYAAYAVGDKQRALQIGAAFRAYLRTPGQRALSETEREGRLALRDRLREITDPNGTRSRVGSGVRRAA